MDKLEAKQAKEEEEGLAPKRDLSLAVKSPSMQRRKSLINDPGKIYIIQVGSRNNFRLAGSNLGSQWI